MKESDWDLNTVLVRQALEQMKSDKIKKTVENEAGQRICITCGRVIERQRLEAWPWATQCVPCKSQEEKKRKGRRGYMVFDHQNSKRD